MEDKKNEIIKYNSILNRMGKKFTLYEGFFLSIKTYFTNNIIYYFFCVLFRFIPLLLISSDFSSIFNKNNNSLLFQKVLKNLTLYNLINDFPISYKVYAIINVLIYCFFLIRLIIYVYILRKMNHNKNNYISHLHNKYNIIISHIQFLLFPYLIEYLSFSYYIYFFSDKYIIKINNKEKPFLILLMIINTIMIIHYNFINNIYFICSNKIYTTTIFDAYSRESKEQKVKYKKLIAYRCSNFIFYIFTLLQNLNIILNIDIYINEYKYKIIYKIILTAILFLIILILFVNRIYKYNYKNFINTSIDVLLLFCFYSIIFDCIILINKYSIKNIISEIIYMLIKLFISYITFSLYTFRSKKYLGLKIVDILFEERNNEKEDYFINSFYYLNEIMMKIKENNDIISIYYLVELLNIHIKNCHKVICNCKLLENLINEEDLINEDIIKLKKYIFELLNILNYLFESSFIEKDFYNKIDLAIILSEHYCHLKNNSTMSFSIINTLIQNQKNNLTKNEMIVLYELTQKYICYIAAKIKEETDIDIFYNKKDVLINKQRFEYFQNYFINLKMSYKIKKFKFDYIDNLIKLLKYKNIFEDSLSFKYDENNDYIISMKLDFLEKISNIENNKKNENNTILNIIINLLKKEKLCYHKLLNYIENFEFIKEMPVFIIFKFYLFYDILEGGKIPDNVFDKLNFFLINKNNNYITKDEYAKLKNLYHSQNNLNDSKHFSIFEFKKDLRIKYFSEHCALKLGYKQKDIINEKIDLLMPKEFCESHQNLIRQKFIGDQSRYFLYNKNLLFDSTSTLLYSINFEVVAIYNMSKYLEFICQFTFAIDNRYKFMLNNNFELLSHSENFENEYYLNKKIFQIYNLNLMNILKINQDKLKKKFDSIYKRINYQNIIRKIKTEEYLIPQLYSFSGFKNNGKKKLINYNISKKNFLTKMLNGNNEDENIYEENNEESDEKKKFINKGKLKKLINQFFINPVQMIFHDSFTITLNKQKFIENIVKELSKIPDNEIIYQNDNSINLIMKGKQLFDRLLTINELSNNFINITIRLSYYYNKSFYFITIDDKKKLFLTMLKEFNFDLNKKNDYISSNSTSASIENLKNSKKNIKSRNKNFKKLQSKKCVLVKTESLKEPDFDKKNLKSNLNITKIKLGNFNEEGEENDVIGRIDKYRKFVNNAKFILIIRIILFIIIFFIFIIYILIMILKKNISNVTEKIIKANYYNFQTRDFVLNIYSRLLQIYYEYIEISLDKLSTLEIQQNVISNYSYFLKENYHNFTVFYYDYNLAINHNFNSLFRYRDFYKIVGLWEKVEYSSRFNTELDVIIYNIYSIDLFYNNIELFNDCNNFLFFNEKNNFTQKPKSAFIKLLFYLCLNYEMVYKDMFNEIHEDIKLSFSNYINYKKLQYFLLETLVSIFYVIFFLSVIIYLYYANQVVVKNILFLFLDFSEEQYDNKYSNNLIILKLLELRNIIDDFNLEKFQRYKINIDKLNKNKIMNNIKNVDNIINSDIREIEINNQNKFENISERKTVPINSYQNKISSTSNLNNIIEINKNLINNNKKNSLEKNIQEIIINNNKLTERKKKVVNNSSHNYLIKSTNSHLFKDSLKTNSIEASNEFLKAFNNKDNNFFKNRKNSIIIKQENPEEKINIQEIILNQKIKSSVLLMKIYKFIILLLLLLIAAFSLIKIQYIILFMTKINGFFKDFTILANRFSLLQYYFNIFRTLIIFHDEEIKNKIEMSMDILTENYEIENNQYTNILLNDYGKYKERKLVFDLLTNKENNSTEKIKEKICKNEKECINYLDSKYNVFDSGIDFSYKTCISKIDNLYQDYKSLINKTNIEDIKSKIINSDDSLFNSISLSISNLLIYIKRSISQSFQSDYEYFKYFYNKILSIFNIISIIFSIITISFVNIFIFVSISRFSRPIKESTYRINCSFYHIKKYSFINLRKFESIYI